MRRSSYEVSKTARTSTKTDGIVDKRLIALFSRSEHLPKNKTFNELVAETGLVVGVAHLTGEAAQIQHRAFAICTQRAGQVADAFLKESRYLLDLGSAPLFKVALHVLSRCWSAGEVKVHCTQFFTGRCKRR